MNKINLISLTCLAAFLISCGGNENNTDVTTMQDTIQTEQAEEIKENKTYYQIPSPDEMFDFIKNSGLTYSDKVLFPSENVTKINEPLKQALNFGIYSADLAYTAAYEEYQTSLKYFAAVQKLADNLGLSNAFAPSMAERIKNNLNNSDSLVTITGETYFSVIDYLEQNEEQDKLAAIATAGWIESMHIVLNLSENNLSDNIKTRIKDQKLTFENIYDYLQNHKENEHVAEVINLVEPLNTFFSELSVNESSKTTFEKKNGKFVLGGDDEVTEISDEQIAQLKTIIEEIRNKITAINA